MKTCPFCKEEVQAEAIKCRHCHSMLLALAPAAATPADDGRTTYILDRDLVRFAKFAVAVLAVFLVVGAYLFGFKLEAALEKVRSTQDDLKVAQEKMAAAQKELDAAQAVTRTLKSDVEKVLAEAKTVVVDISSQRSLAIDIVTSMRQLTPQQAAVLQASKDLAPKMARGAAQGKLWQAGTTLRVRFIGGDAKAHELARAAAAQWAQHANLRFEFVDVGNAEIRVAFEPGKGSWSYLGTDALGIAMQQPTMNLGFVDRRSALHEFGHVLGLIEEHLNPRADIRWNRERITKELSGPPNFWSPEQIDANVFRKVPASALPPYREFDPKSIMNMSFDPSWTGGLPLGQGDQLSDSDKTLVARLYPR